MRRKVPLGKRIAASAYRFWIAKNLTEWPTVRQVAKNLRLRVGEIQECEGDGYFMLTSFHSFEETPLGEHFVEAMTEDVDKVWKAFWDKFDEDLKVRREIRILQDRIGVGGR